MRRVAISGVLVIGLAAAGYWGLSAPAPLPAGALDGIEGDAERGEAVFWAAGCASCHADGEAEDDERLVLSGGQRFESDFGTFVAPNISPDPEHGIGGWSTEDFANAMLRGVAPDGAHYFPAFPYTSYAKADPEDAVHLKAFMDTLPESDRANESNEVAFPFNIRRNIGIWKRLYLDTGWVIADDLGEEAERGRYLSEALAHCAQCHTPRGALGGLDTRRWMAGAEDPSGDDRIPGITPAQLDWSEREIASYLEMGFTPDFDTAGGTMRAVVKSLAELDEADRAAIAAYVKALPEAE